jgi:hypothetical protein
MVTEALGQASTDPQLLLLLLLLSNSTVFCVLSHVLFICLLISSTVNSSPEKTIIAH